MIARQFIEKLGRLNTIILITVFSVLLSVLITWTALYYWQNPINFYLVIFIAIIAPLLIAPLVSWPLITLIIKIDNLEKEMRELATYDSLTGVLNRRAFLHESNIFIDFAKREKMPIAIFAIDLDNFKIINDRYGHSAGDEVLNSFGKTIITLCRKSDLIGRMGGEEFALILPNTNEENAFVFSEKLHSKVRESTIIHDQSSIKYTISMGLVSGIPNQIDSIESILKEADKLLYLAKEQGRNRTITSNATMQINTDTS